MSLAEVVMDQDNHASQSDHISDDQLLTRWQDGNETAATMLYERYYFRLLRFVGATMGPVLKGVEDPFDVTQSIFLSVFGSGCAERIEIGPNNSLWPLLAAIAVNKIRNHVKYWQRDCRDISRLIPLTYNYPSAVGPQAEDQARLDEVTEELLKPFSPLRRRIIKSLLQGLPIAEVASRAETSERTVYKTRQAAMLVLERILKAS